MWLVVVAETGIESPFSELLRRYGEAYAARASMVPPEGGDAS